MSNTRHRVSNNTNTSDQGSFYFLFYCLRNANVDSSYNQIISIRSRTVIRLEGWNRTVCTEFSSFADTDTVHTGGRRVR